MLSRGNSATLPLISTVNNDRPEPLILIRPQSDNEACIEGSVELSRPT